MLPAARHKQRLVQQAAPESSARLMVLVARWEAVHYGVTRRQRRARQQKVARPVVHAAATVTDAATSAVT